MKLGIIIPLYLLIFVLYVVCSNLFIYIKRYRLKHGELITSFIYGIVWPLTICLFFLCSLYWLGDKIRIGLQNDTVIIKRSGNNDNSNYW